MKRPTYDCGYFSLIFWNFKRSGRKKLRQGARSTNVKKNEIYLSERVLDKKTRSLSEEDRPGPSARDLTSSVVRSLKLEEIPAFREGGERTSCFNAEEKTSHDLGRSRLVVSYHT